MKQTHVCEIVRISQINEKTLAFSIKSDIISSTAKPGQFLHIQAPGVYLRRPFAVCDIEDNLVKFAFIVKGHGTKSLASLKEGDTLSCIGPLGNGFQYDSQEGHLLIGGGAGIFPLLFLAKSMNNPKVVLGFRNSQSIIMQQEFTTVAKDVIIATEDGSYGFHGNSCQAAMPYLKKAPMIYACGPTPMLKSIQNIGVPCQISLEERMGCGIGACLVCACAQKGQENNGYHRVCKDGPVFWGDEVEL